MIIAGINLGRTKNNKELKGGGVCIVENGKIVLAIAEERISGIKGQGGYKNSLSYLLRNLGIQKKDINKYIISSCCESTRNINRLIDLNIYKNTHEFISHHLSHAYSTFFTSPFEKALIIVMDGGGNVISETSDTNWWEQPREQLSYYLGDGNKIKLLERDFYHPYDTGLGEIYRYFTHHLGWRTSDASKVMALSAFGDADKWKNKRTLFFDEKDNKIKSSILNDPFDPSIFTKFLKINNFGDIPPRKQDEEIQPIHMDLARYVQDKITEVMILKIRYLLDKYKIQRLCLSGGVALNCQMNEEIINKTCIEDIYIQPAANDQGQCLGNAIFGSIKYDSWVRIKEFNPFIGPQIEINIERIINECIAKGFQNYYIVDQKKSLNNIIANEISRGKIVAWFQGRSEFGPRALGNRSILADPRLKATSKKLNIIKEREWFNPFAPSILEQYVSDFFYTNKASPFMLRAIRAKEKAIIEIPAVIHYDNTARVQTVNIKQNEDLYNLIYAFFKLTGVPVLLNTSFNCHGKPIVNDPFQALDAFQKLDIDILVIHNLVIER